MGRVGHVARSRQVCIQLVVEALLILVYLPEEKRKFICTFDLPCCLRPSCHLVPAQLNLQLPFVVSRPRVGGYSQARTLVHSYTRTFVHSYIRTLVHSYTRTFVYLSWTGTSWSGTAGQGSAIIGRDRYSTERDFLCVHVFARPQVE